MFPNRVPTDRDTLSPQPTGQGRRFYLFIHSRMSAGVPKKEPSYIHTYIQEKHKVTVHGAPRRRKAYIKWGTAWFPMGMFSDGLKITGFFIQHTTLLFNKPPHITPPSTTVDKKYTRPPSQYLPNLIFFLLVLTALCYDFTAGNNQYVGYNYPIIQSSVIIHSKPPYFIRCNLHIMCSI